MLLLILLALSPRVHKPKPLTLLSKLLYHAVVHLLHRSFNQQSFKSKP